MLCSGKSSRPQRNAERVASAAIGLLAALAHCSRAPPKEDIVHTV
jgi:hypothetical protein